MFELLIFPAFFWKSSKTWTPVFYFCLFYFAFNAIYYFTGNLVNHRNEEYFSMSKDEDYWNGQNKVAIKVLTFFLGFYVGSMMNRWWKQISALPDIRDVAITLNSLFKPSKQLKIEIKPLNILHFDLQAMKITNQT